MVEAIISILLGLACGLFGFKFSKMITSIAWFIVGVLISGTFLDSMLSGIPLAVVCVLVGLVFCVLGYKLEKLAIIIAVAYFAYGTIASYIYFDDHVMSMVVQLGLSIGVGMLAVLCIRPVFIVATSLYGANMINTAIAYFITLDNTVKLVILIVLVAMFITYQFKTTKNY